MSITRRDFLKYCSASAAAIGLNAASLTKLEAALVSDGAPTLIWLHGSGCQGDSVSFLNLFANLEPVGTTTVDKVLINNVNLTYHTVVMASAGRIAAAMAKRSKRQGGYVLVLEGAVPKAFDGRACTIMSVGGEDVTYLQAVKEYAQDAIAVLCVGTCASFGGVPRASNDFSEPNGPTDVTGGKEALDEAGITGKTVINVPGCPAHPAWVAWTVVQLILGNSIEQDNYGRPVALYGNKDVDDVTLNIHENCPRNVKLGPPNSRATTFGMDHKCLEDLGCRGPLTYADCPSRKWNNGENGPVNWCVDANAPCLGCVEPDFPGGDFYA